MNHELRTKVERDLVLAIKSKDSGRVSTLRFLLSAIKYREVDKKSELNDEETIEVIAKQVKTHKESIEAYTKGSRPDLAEKETAELKILESYLPKQLSEDEIADTVRGEISKIKSSGQTPDLGSVMKVVMPLFKGRAEGQLVKSVVENVLSA
ncbi:MAG: GatB/YqeY domain-containing protein [Patescibacteria group bacterium]|nr:GatB/YqeY domain-containing protein [Patescibacteria group bacterium]